MHETLHDDHTPISISVRLICNLRFEDDIDLITSTEILTTGMQIVQTHKTIDNSKVIVTGNGKVEVYYRRGKQF